MKKILCLFTSSLLMMSAFGQIKAEWVPSDTITFESPSADILISPDSGNLWQIGKPQKTFFSNAHTGSKAIVTDTLNPYPPDDTSSFIYTIRQPFLQSCATCLSFSHKYDMDTVGDRGIIEASYDGGNSWLIVKDTNLNSLQWGFSYFNWSYDFIENTGNIMSHKLITSGRSDGWIRSEFCWQWFMPVKTDTIIPMPDSLLIRFTFISDSIVKNKDGWIIDDMVAVMPGPGDCSGIKENAFDKQISVFPNPFTTTTQISLNQTYHNITLAVYDIQGKLMLQNEYPNCDKIILNRNGLNNGMYFLRITLDGKWVETRKMVVSE